jgi:phosphoribosylaminoimidazole-succinocarboxamide synthase
MAYKKGDLLYEGKAKKVFSVAGEPDLVWLEYKDSLTAFNALKKGSFAGKGQLNRNIASAVFKFLKKLDIQSHWIEDIGDHEMVCRKLEMIPLEVVIRNRIAGSLAKKFGLDEGKELERPLLELYYKSDTLQDPFLSDDQALTLKFVESQSILDECKRQALLVNSGLREMFGAAGIDVIDFKIEFGSANGKIMLADEISPDSCRLWDQKTGEKLDKDRFRRDLGKVEESYQEVWERLQNGINDLQNRR